MLHLALAQRPQARSLTLRHAASLAREARIVTAVVGAMDAPSRQWLTKAVDVTPTDAPGRILVLQLLQFFEGAERRALIAEASDAGRERPATIGDLARGDMSSFWPHVGGRIGATDAEKLWQHALDWPARARLSLNARIATCLPELRIEDAERELLRDLATASVDSRTHADFRQLASTLSPTNVDDAVALVERLGGFSVPPLIARCLEIEDRISDAVSMLATIADTPWYWPTVAAVIAQVEHAELADALKAHLFTVPPWKASLFIEDHGPALARAIPADDLYALTRAMEPQDLVRSLGALIPFVASRDAWLAEAWENILELPSWSSNAYALIPCARWLRDEDAFELFELLLETHELFGSALVGADGSPDEVPGIWQLVPLIERVGGAAALEEVVVVLVEPIPS
jgi:hypothetical protein